MSRLGRQRLAVALPGLLCGLAIVALAAVPSAIAAKVKTRSATVTAAPGEYTSAVARCPIATRLVGGGFASAPDPQPPIVEASHRLGRRSWIVKGIREDQPLTLTSYVYCRAGAPRLRQRTETVPIAVGPLGGFETQTAIAECPNGRRAVAGGFEVEVDVVESAGALVAESLRTGRREWAVTATHGNEDLSLDLTSYAYCAKRKRPRRSASTAISDTDSGAVVTPACRRTVLAGGFLTDPFQLEGSPDNAIVTVESRRRRNRWRTVGQHLGTGTTASLSGFGYCG